MIDKLLILYSPDRTFGKTVYDCIEMRDGELMINSGVSNTGPKSKLFFCGGLTSILPIMELIHGITIYSNDFSKLSLDTILNDYLRLVISIMS